MFYVEIYGSEDRLVLRNDLDKVMIGCGKWGMRLIYINECLVVDHFDRKTVNEHVRSAEKDFNSRISAILIYT